MAYSRKRIDLTGQKFGRLTVIEQALIKGKNQTNLNWVCQCECGNKTITSTGNLRQAHRPTKSCGCLLRDNHMKRILGREKAIGGLGAGFRVLIKKYTKRAMAAGYCFTLSDNEFAEITQRECFYCGCPPFQTSRPKALVPYTYNGLDRLNSNFGYEKDNVVACCGPCNVMKMKMPLDEFKERISRIYNHSIQVAR